MKLYWLVIGPYCPCVPQRSLLFETADELLLVLLLLNASYSCCTEPPLPVAVLRSVNPRCNWLVLKLGSATLEVALPYAPCTSFSAEFTPLAPYAGATAAVFAR